MIKLFAGLAIIAAALGWGILMSPDPVISLVVIVLAATLAGILVT